MKSECILCKSDHDFMLVFNNSHMLFRYNQVLPLTGNDVLLFSKGTFLHQSTHFEPSTMNIGSGVQAVGDGKNKKGKGRKGKDTIKMHKSVIFHTRVAKAPTMRSLLNLAQLLI